MVTLDFGPCRARLGLDLDLGLCIAQTLDPGPETLYCETAHLYRTLGLDLDLGLCIAQTLDPAHAFTGPWTLDPGR